MLITMHRYCAHCNIELAFEAEIKLVLCHAHLRCQNCGHTEDKNDIYYFCSCECLVSWSEAFLYWPDIKTQKQWQEEYNERSKDLSYEIEKLFAVDCETQSKSEYLKK